MSSRPLLNPAPASQEEVDRLLERIEDLKTDNAALQESLRDARQEIQDTRQQVKVERRAIENLKHILLPWKQALQGLFREMDQVESIEDEPAEVASRPSDKAKWEAWQRKLPGKPAEFIAELLIHGEMTGQQLKVATKCGQQTVYDTIAKLNKAQLLEKNGGKYSLRQS